MTEPGKGLPVIPLMMEGLGLRVVGITGVNGFGKYRHCAVAFTESEPQAIGAALARAERQTERAAEDRAAARLSAENENREADNLWQSGISTLSGES